MFAKSFNLVLVYIVTICNVIVLASPVLAAAVPFMHFNDHKLIINHAAQNQILFAFFFLAFVVSFLMLLYLVLDFLFSFSMRSSLKNCTRFEKVKDYEFLTEIINQVRDKFGERNVKLYIKNVDEINAYAISSMGGKAIVLTRGLVEHYLVECPDPKKFLYALRSTIGHEMSHLINKDFLPTFLIITNQKITNLVSGILFFTLNIGIRIVKFLPYGGKTTSRLMGDTYTIINFVITAFNRFVVYNTYEFLRRFVSRTIEFRCDMQSAKAFGGQNMALALSMLGESGYFTLFSTHPRTSSRINRVKDVKAQDGIIHASFFDSIANYFSLMFLAVTCLYFAKQAHVDLMARQYLKNHEAINRKLMMLWHLIMQIF
jgi:Zn-dependent protease with chaperone function